MPAKLDRCRDSLMEKWGKDPSTKPKRYKSGDKWKMIESRDDLISAATAICRASTGLSEQYSQLSEQAVTDLSVVLKEGVGPVLRGVAFVNRPYLKFMRPLEVVMREGKEMIRAQLVRYGFYEYPLDPNGVLMLTQEFWSKIRENFLGNAYGQKIFADRRHDPEGGSMGELVALEDTGDGMDGLFDPTPTGLQAVKNREVNYASVDFVYDHADTRIEVVAGESVMEELDWSQILFLTLAEGQVIGNPNEEVDMGDNHETPPTDEVTLADDPELVQLKEQLKSDRAAFLQEQAEFRAERARQREELRRQKVELKLEDLRQPRDGKALDKPVLEMIGQILLGDEVKIGEGDGIKLSDEQTAVNVHGYYREAVMVLADRLPRTVPVGSQVEPANDRPRSGEDAERKRERKLRRDAMLMAKQDAKGGATLTEAEIAEVDGKLDVMFGVEEG